MTSELLKQTIENDFENLQGKKKLNVLPHLFGSGMMRAENYLFALAQEYSEQYTGGLWEYRKKEFIAVDDEGNESKKAVYVFIAPEGNYKFINTNNYCSEEMNHHEFGITITLYMLQYMFEVDSSKTDALVDLYYGIKDNVCTTAIYKAID